MVFFLFYDKLLTGWRAWRWRSNRDSKKKKKKIKNPKNPKGQFSYKEKGQHFYMTSAAAAAVWRRRRRRNHCEQLSSTHAQQQQQLLSYHCASTTCHDNLVGIRSTKKYKRDSTILPLLDTHIALNLKNDFTYWKIERRQPKFWKRFERETFI